MFSLHHVSLSVSNIETSVHFYEVFGFRKVFEWHSDSGSLRIAHLKLDDIFLELFSYRDYQPPPPSTKELATDLPVLGIRHFALRVQSLEAAIRLLHENGFKDDIKGTEGRTGIKYFFVKDPDGTFVEIVQDDRDL